MLSVRWTIVYSIISTRGFVIDIRNYQIQKVIITGLCHFHENFIFRCITLINLKLIPHQNPQQQMRERHLTHACVDHLFLTDCFTHIWAQTYICVSFYDRRHDNLLSTSSHEMRRAICQTNVVRAMTACQHSYIYSRTVPPSHVTLTLSKLCIMNLHKK